METSNICVKYFTDHICKEQRTLTRCLKRIEQEANAKESRNIPRQNVGAL